jgi:hypothetical protein
MKWKDALYFILGLSVAFLFSVLVHWSLKPGARDSEKPKVVPQRASSIARPITATQITSTGGIKYDIADARMSSRISEATNDVVAKTVESDRGDRSSQTLKRRGPYPYTHEKSRVDTNAAMSNIGGTIIKSKPDASKVTSAMTSNASRDASKNELKYNENSRVSMSDSAIRCPLSVSRAYKQVYSDVTSNDVQWCKNSQKTYSVIIGKKFGTMPRELQKK